MGLDVSVLFNGGSYEVEIDKDSISDLQQLLVENNKKITNDRDTPLIELEDDKLYSNGTLNVIWDNCSDLEKVFTQLISFLGKNTMSAEIYNEGSDSTVVLKYDGSKLNRSIL